MALGRRLRKPATTIQNTKRGAIVINGERVNTWNQFGTTTAFEKKIGNRTFVINPPKLQDVSNGDINEREKRVVSTKIDTPQYTERGAIVNIPNLFGIYIDMLLPATRDGLSVYYSNDVRQSIRRKIYQITSGQHTVTPSPRIYISVPIATIDPTLITPGDDYDDDLFTPGDAQILDPIDIHVEPRNVVVGQVIQPGGFVPMTRQ